MQLRALKYGMVFVFIAVGYTSLLMGGTWSYALLAYSFGLIPLLEVFLSPDESNLSKVEQEMVRADRVYDWLIYATVPLHLGMVILMLFQVTRPEVPLWEMVGLVIASGISCGVLGINVAHELGHRHKKYERVMAKILLLSSLYMHFIIEHNRGHHARVATEADPASSRRGEILYFFWIRSVIHSYLSAWELENSRLRRKNKPVFSLHNEMLVFQLIQITLLVVVGLVFGWVGLACFVGSAVFGFLLLETVNYIEHYGLHREEIAEGRYERVTPSHSWNSNHPIGRMMLFELSRHSDHHARAGRKYQTLRHMEEAPQMPTGYPGMMLLSMVPPLWFGVMHRNIDRYGLENGVTTPSLA